MTNALVETAGALTEKILSIGDHLRVQAHLGGMDAAESWETLSENLQGALQRLTVASDKLTDLKESGRYQAELALMQAKDSWQSLKAQLEKSASVAGESTDQLVEQTKETLVKESQALIDRLEDGVRTLSKQIKH